MSEMQSLCLSTGNTTRSDFIDQRTRAYQLKQSYLSSNLVSCMHHVSLKRGNIMHTQCMLLIPGSMRSK